MLPDCYDVSRPPSTPHSTPMYLHTAPVSLRLSSRSGPAGYWHCGTKGRRNKLLQCVYVCALTCVCVRVRVHVCVFVHFTWSRICELGRTFLSLQASPM